MIEVKGVSQILFATESLKMILVWVMEGAE